MEMLEKSDKIINVTEDVKHSLELYKRDLNDEKTVLKDLEYAQVGSDNWGTKNADLIVDIKQRLKDWMDMDVDQQTKLYATLDSLADAEQEILQEQQLITKDLAETHEIIVSNTKELEHLADNTCPYCKQQFKETKEKVTACTSEYQKQTATKNY